MPVVVTVDSSQGRRWQPRSIAAQLHGEHYQYTYCMTVKSMYTAYVSDSLPVLPG